mgnify:CR=1 FL=1|jgi:choline dehydrogenase-like flavoprotein
MSPYTSQEQLLRGLLEFIALICGLLGILAGFRFAEAGAGLGLLAFCAWFAAADVRRFRLLSWAVSGGLGMLALFFTILALEVAEPTASTPTIRPLLIIGLFVSGAASLALLIAILRTTPSADTVLPWKTLKPQTIAERWSRIFLGIFAFMTLITAFLFLHTPSRFAPEIRGWEIAVEFVPSGALFFALVALFAVIAAFDVRAHGEALSLIIIGIILAMLASLLSSARAVDLMAQAGILPAIPLWATLLLYAALALSIWLLRGWVNRSLIDYTRFFAPGQFWALAAISDGLIEGGAGEKLQPHEIALRVDNHLASFPAPRLALSRVALAALDILIPFIFSLRPPLSYMHLSDRAAFLNRQFKTDIVERRGVYALFDRLNLAIVSELVEGVMRFIMQFAYLGYYGAPNVQQSIGYTPFSARPAAKALSPKPIRRHPPLNVTLPADADRMGLDVIDDADVVIIGSGAAGSILAERLLARGRRVLLLEKGRYVQPEEFSEDEVEMIGKLYGDNALQVTSSLRFTILQGSCVGGTTVVNNAVSFPTPQHILERWNNDYGAALNETDFWNAQQAVIDRLNIRPIDETAVTRPADQIVNPVAHRLQKGIDAVLTAGDYIYKPVSANITDCLGCGYCNLGCKYGRKLSMLDEVLPKAQHDHGDALQIMSEAEAVHLKADGDQVEEVVVRLGGRRTIHIRHPKTVIVAGGAIASSWLLMRSGIGRNLPVGQRLCFNMGSPLHAQFDTVMNAYDGLQISHYLQIANQHDFIFETWFNPPVAQSLVMPGWLDTHFLNMSDYNRMVAMGVVVGTDARPETHIRGAALFPGSPEVVYKPSPADLDKLVDSMILMGRVLLASGAERILASTRHYHTYTSGQAYFRSEDDLDYLKTLVKSDEDLLLSSAHPQGGTPLGTVLDANFRVRGYRNLYVCDASAFPSAITVNPQLTVMNLAWYAAERIE